MAFTPTRLQKREECVALLRQVMECVDKVLLPSTTADQDKLELAAAYLQQALTLFDEAETPEP